MKTPYIILKMINPDILDQKYNFSEYENKNMNCQKTNDSQGSSSYQKTKVYDQKENPSLFSYIDEAKRDHICTLSMKDVIKNEKLPLKTNLLCFHCHHSFSTIPIGCPIDYKSSKIYKNYYSEITKNNYVLQESISDHATPNDKNSSSLFQTDRENLGYYVTDGIFCSFQCCKAFILNNKHKELYKQSDYLLNCIYMNLFNIKEEFEISPAPDWRILENFGGNVNIDFYRKNFNKIEYRNSESYLKDLPNCKTIGFVFEKKIKL